MGWSSGTDLLGEVLDTVLPHIPKAKRQKVCGELIDSFEANDADSLQELMGEYPEFDAAMMTRLACDECCKEGKRAKLRQCEECGSILCSKCKCECEDY